MPREKLTFKNSDGDELSALIDMPATGKPVAYALFAHCFTCSKNLNAVGNISRALNRYGLAVLRFDFTGLGESEGDFADTNFSSNVADLIAAAEFLEREHQAPRLLIGHSLGGAAVLQAAHDLPSVKAIATIGAPADPVHVKHLLSEREEEIRSSGKATVTLAGRSFTIKKQFLDDLEQKKMKKSISELKRALLILHSPVDNIVGVDNAADIFMAAKHPKSYVSLDHADHLLTKSEDSVYAGEVIAAWAGKFLEKERSAARPKTADENWTVVHTGKSGFLTDVSAKGHPLLADEPESVGGTDKGPSPYDLLTASLGACTSMTLRMYADHKKWPLQDIYVRLRHRKTYAQDCEKCEDKNAKIDEIEREIEVTGDLDQEQRERLLEIADRCPVHRTLHSDVVINSRLKE